MSEGTHLVPDGEHVGPASDFVQGVTTHVFPLGGWEAVSGCSISVLFRVLLYQEGFTTEELRRGIAAGLANTVGANMTGEEFLAFMDELESETVFQIQSLREHIANAPGHGHA